MKLSDIIKQALSEGQKATKVDWMPHQHIYMNEDGDVFDDRGKAFSDAKFRQIDKYDNLQDWVFID